MSSELTREATRVYEQNLRSRNAGLPATLTIEEWLNILERFDRLCAYCQQKPFELMDHLIPHFEGGGSTAENCVPACRVCNSRKGTILTVPLEESISPEERLIQVRSALQNKQVPRIDRVRNHWAVPREVMTYYHTEEEKAIITEIRTYYGLNSDNDALRFALRAAKREMEQLRAKAEHA